MAEKKSKEKDKVSYKNSVSIAGYLKENTLELVSNENGQSIRGSIIVSTGKVSDYKIQFWVGEKNKSFDNMLELLPQNTVTIASFLKENQSADYETAITSVSKVWVLASFDEYVSRVGERDPLSMTTLKGIKGGFSKKEGSEFVPKADFTVDLYINKLEKELNEKDEETGRLLLEGLLPKYKDSASVIDFVVVEEENAAQYISTNFKVGDTVTLTGEVINIRFRKLVEGSDKEHFGKAAAPQYETMFVEERRVTGGDPKRKEKVEEGMITAGMAKEWLAQREVTMVENGNKKKANSEAKAEASKGFGAAAKTSSSVESEDDGDGFDF